MQQTILQLAASATPFVADEGVSQAGGEAPPRKRFVKDLIAVGDYTHPEKQWSLHVTPERLDAWVEHFNAARANGIDFEVTLDHSPSARSVIGYLTSIYRDGHRLMGVHEFIGDDAIDLAQRVKNVSVEIDPDFVDGKGVRYGESIVKSSLVQQPVVPGQLAFSPLRIAASRSRVGEEDAGPGAADEAIEAQADEVESRLESLVKLGRLTPFARGLLRATLAGEPGRRPALLLSRGVASGGKPARSLARRIVEALEQNAPVPMGVSTGVQVLELSRVIPGAEDTDEFVKSRVEQHNKSLAARGA